jgi:hypothetical protein
MPALASLAAFTQAVAEFPVSDPGLVLEPAARAAAGRSAAESGLVLLGEVHGVRENPLLISALLQALGLTGLALEWDAELAPMVSAFLAGGALADHPALWSGDGRITAGHLAVLRERSAAGPLELTLMDGALPGGRGSADWSWSRRDEAMADRVLAAAVGPGTLVVAGNAHTPVHPTELGVPLGAVLAARRPGLREIRIDYRSGRYYNLAPRRFAPRTGLGPPSPRLVLRNENLTLELPSATEAVVPQRPWRPGQPLTTTGV